MSHITLVIKSNPLSVSSVLIPDLGYGPSAGGSTITLSDHAEITEALASEDMRTLSQDNAFPAHTPNTNSIILNDGTNDIPPGEVDDFLDGMEQGRRNNCAATAPPTVGDDESIGYGPCSRWVITSGPDKGKVFVNYDGTAGAALWLELSNESGNEEAVFKDFTFGSGTPLVITSLSPGDKIINSEIEIDGVFNGTTPTALLGTPGTPDLVMEATDSKLSKIGTYANGINHSFASSDTLQLVLSLGASTTGSGRALVTIRRS